jgi:hypothetical protein
MGCVSSKKKLSKSDLEFLEENTEFTKDQIVEWYEGFIVSRIPIGERCKARRKNSKLPSFPMSFLFFILHIKQSYGSSA